MGLLRTLLIILLVYYIFKFLARLFAPYFINKVAENLQKRASQQYQHQQYQQDVREGETVIDKKPTSSNSSSKKVGEYVDFEEID